LAEPEPEAPVVAPPPPPPPEKPRPPKRPKPLPKPPQPKPAPAPKPASAPAAPAGVPAAAPLGPVAAPNPGPPAGAAQSGAKLNSEYVEPSYQAAYLSNPKPAYPSASRRMEEEGKVTLRVHITADGQADQVLLHQGSGFERLDQAAMEAVRRWRFVPARRGRENVPGWVMVPIQFSLGS
jgi:protein TonB